ncbi:MAG: hypothetical protein OXE40_03245 [Gammaproteobacteria bacterium]|nr:hypothetical protein [Gammaproteobacteria bacterium]
MPADAVRSSEERRRRLLRDMGIEVWYARGRAEEACSGKAGESAEAAATEAVKARGGPDDSGVPGPADNGPPATEPAPSVPGTEQSAATDAAERVDDAPFAVVALGMPGALLIVDASPRRQDAVLARDVLRAALRDWSAAVGQARFEWPQPGVKGAPGPALTAFVEKQAEDVSARLVLITESVAGRLGDCPLDLVSVPDLPSLAETRNKIALWRRIQQRPP